MKFVTLQLSILIIYKILKTAPLRLRTVEKSITKVRRSSRSINMQSTGIVLGYLRQRTDKNQISGIRQRTDKNQISKFVKEQTKIKYLN